MVRSVREVAIYTRAPVRYAVTFKYLENYEIRQPFDNSCDEYRNFYCIWKVTLSNLGRYEHRDCYFSWLSSVIPCKCWDSIED